jgi:hypothetical protein
MANWIFLVKEHPKSFNVHRTLTKPVLSPTLEDDFNDDIPWQKSIPTSYKEATTLID